MSFQSVDHGHGGLAVSGGSPGTPYVCASVCAFYIIYGSQEGARGY